MAIIFSEQQEMKTFKKVMFLLNFIQYTEILVETSS